MKFTFMDASEGYVTYYIQVTFKSLDEIVFQYRSDYEEDLSHGALASQFDEGTAVDFAEFQCLMKRQKGYEGFEFLDVEK